MKSDTPLRLQALQKLYFDSFQSLREAVHTAQPSLTADHIETILGAASRLLDKYPGSEDDQGAFVQWAVSAIIEPGAALLFALTTLTGEHVHAVRSGTTSVLINCSDLGVVPSPVEKGQPLGTVDEIAAETWVKILLNLEKWLTPSFSKTPGQPPAKLATRLYAFARLQALSSINDVASRYADEDKLTTVGDYKRQSSVPMNPVPASGRQVTIPAGAQLGRDGQGRVVGYKLPNGQYVPLGGNQ